MNASQNGNDFSVTGHGSVVLLTPHTSDARAWLDDNVAQGLWFAGALAVEPRYLNNLMDGILSDGFSVDTSAIF